MIIEGMILFYRSKRIGELEIKRMKRLAKLEIQTIQLILSKTPASLKIYAKMPV